MSKSFPMVCTIALVSIQAVAEPEPLATGFDIVCDIKSFENLQTAKYFTSLQNEAKLFALRTCENMLADPTGAIRNVDVLLKGTDELMGSDGYTFSFSSSLFKAWIDSFDSKVFDGMSSLAYDFSFHRPNAITRVDDFKGLITRTSDECADGDSSECRFSLEYRSSTAELTYRFYEKGDQSLQQAKVCQAMGFSSCDKALEDLSLAIEPYNYFIKEGHTANVIKSLNKLNREWDSFSERSRYQTFIDKWLTTEIYSDQLNGKEWSMPPKYQYFLMHPSVVLDHFDSAEKGTQSEPGLAIEWIGINKWNGKFPMGVSLASVYADRSAGKRIGHGLMLHFDNSYSIGFANRGSGDNSVFINLNLFNWFTEKQDKYQTYKDKIGKFKGD